MNSKRKFEKQRKMQNFDTYQLTVCSLYSICFLINECKKIGKYTGDG